ncbi:MAG: hypothetical protein ABEK10_00385 [Candidatus Nanosalina sp.]
MENLEELGQLEKDVRDRDADVFREVESWYSEFKDTLREELDEVEDEYTDETCDVSEVVAFAPIKRIREDYREDISEAEFLVGMSLTLIKEEDAHKLVPQEHDSDAWRSFSDRFGMISLGQIGPEDEIELDWVGELIRFLRDREYQKPIGRYYPEQDAVALNKLFGYSEVDPEKVPMVMLPLIGFLLARSDDLAKSTLLHEMTHAYIRKRSGANFTAETSGINAIDEAAAQTVSDLSSYFFKQGGRENLPSSSYYMDEGLEIDREIMQAAREALTNSIRDKDSSEWIDTVRKRAIKAIGKIEDGEDPIKAVREEDDHRARMIRITAYTIRETVKDAVEDMHKLGLELEFIGCFTFEKFVDNNSTNHRLKLDLSPEYHETLGKLRSDLVEPSKELEETVRKFNQKVSDDYLSEKLSESEKKILQEVFGSPHWTDPAAESQWLSSNPQRGSEELKEHLVYLLKSYGKIVEVYLQKSGELEEILKVVLKKSRKLEPEYENERYTRDVANLEKKSRKIMNQIQETEQNLKAIEEMIETGIKKLQNLEEGKELE